MARETVVSHHSGKIAASAVVDSLMKVPDSL